MPFDFDVFISYAHIDDEALADGEPGWIATLHRVLEVRLAQLLGERPRIWRDPKLQGNDVFDETITEQLTGAAALVSVVSPRYVRSEWCTREWQAFLEAAEAQGGLRVGDKARVFKVVKTPVPLAEQPAPADRLLGYEFFEVDPETGRPREFNRVFGPDAQQQYFARVEDLAYDLRDVLESLRRARPAAAPEGATVYLAEATSDVGEARDAVRRELQQRGHTVLPDRPLPLDGPALEAAVAEALARSDLAVHLVGARYGVVPEAAERSVVEIQNALAAARSAEAGLERLLWLPPGLAPDDARQHAFVEALRNDRAAQRGADLLQTPLEDLKTLIQDRLDARARPAPPPDAAGEDRPPLVYLLCDRADVDAVGPLEDDLFERGMEVALPLFEGDEAAVREDHESTLRLCDGVLIYYGAGTEAWLRGKLRDLRKAPGFGRAAPLRATAVYVAPPATPRKARFRTHEADAVIQQPEGGFTAAALDDFAARLATDAP
ncbi:MAG: TIR domain-containing protein [Rhodothermales bacterium]|nr:TIR domain-containing protein [Rhodothermales bacterium]